MGAQILVADDSEEISSFLADYLSAMGHAVMVVDNGVHLLRRAIELRPHLIITDVQMSGGSGCAAYWALRQDEKTKNIPVLFVSAQTSGALIADTPSTRTLSKPIDHKKFSEFVAELLPLGGYRP